MTIDDHEMLSVLLAKEAIRELAQLYARGVDRKDGDLLRTIYTADATDTHVDSFDGSANDYVDFLEQSFPYMTYSGHHICNHLISVDGNEGEGEVYALAYHFLADGDGGWIEDAMCVRYIDRYRREDDEQWRFAKRVVTYDFHTQRPIDADAVRGQPLVADDPSYTMLRYPLFSRGARSSEF